MKLLVNIKKFFMNKFVVDRLDYTSECVPISDTMEFKMKVRDSYKELKYRIKHIIKK